MELRSQRNPADHSLNSQWWPRSWQIHPEKMPDGDSHSSTTTTCSGFWPYHIRGASISLLLHKLKSLSDQSLLIQMYNPQLWFVTLDKLKAVQSHWMDSLSICFYKKKKLIRCVLGVEPAQMRRRLQGLKLWSSVGTIKQRKYNSPPLSLISKFIVNRPCGF